MKLLVNYFLGVALLCAGTVSVSAQIQPIGDFGSVDWSDQVIVSKGIGASNPKDPIAVQRATALRVAKLTALRNALETFKGINLTSETTVNNFIMESDIIRTSVEGFVKGFQVPKDGENYMSDGSVEVEVRIPLAGLMAAAPQLIWGGKQAVAHTCPTCGQPWPAGKPAPQVSAGVTAPVYEGAKGTVYSGLIIDARGLGVKPAMSPKILDENGKEIYGSMYVKKEFALKQGMVGYARDPKKAAKLERAGKNPGMVKALRASGKNKADLVIANKDAADVMAAKENMSFLEKCRVIIVVD